MKEKRRSNYDIMQEQMQRRFLEYDQTAMIRRFCPDHDTKYLYLQFFDRRYRIGREDGRVEWSEDNFANVCVAGYNEAMSIYDVLCCSKEHCRLSGSFCGIHQMKGTVLSSQPGSALFASQAAALDGRTAAFRAACEQLGGEKRGRGDVSYLLHPFEFLPMILQFWNADDEFPASLNILWDENVLDYIHYETSFFIGSYALQRILELVTEMAECNLPDT